MWERRASSGLPPFVVSTLKEDSEGPNENMFVCVCVVACVCV